MAASAFKQRDTHFERRDRLLDRLAENELEEHLVQVDIDDPRVKQSSTDKHPERLVPAEPRSAPKEERSVTEIDNSPRGLRLKLRLTQQHPH